MCLAARGQILQSPRTTIRCLWAEACLCPRYSQSGALSASSPCTPTSMLALHRLQRPRTLTYQCGIPVHRHCSQSHRRCVLFCTCLDSAAPWPICWDDARFADKFHGRKTKTVFDSRKVRIFRTKFAFGIMSGAAHYAIQTNVRSGCMLWFMCTRE